MIDAVAAGGLIDGPAGPPVDGIGDPLAGPLDWRAAGGHRDRGEHGIDRPGAYRVLGRAILLDDLHKVLGVFVRRAVERVACVGLAVERPIRLQLALAVVTGGRQLLKAIFPNVAADRDPQRLEQLLPDVLLEGGAGNVLDNSLQIQKSFPGVAEAAARLKQDRQRSALSPPTLAPVGEAAGVRQNHPCSYPLVERLVGQVRLVEVFAKRPVQVELPSFDELQGKVSQGRLAHRAGFEHRVSVDFLGGAGSSDAILTIPGDSPILNPHDRYPGDVERVHPLGHPLVEQRRDRATVGR